MKNKEKTPTNEQDSQNNSQEEEQQTLEKNLETEGDQEKSIEDMKQDIEQLRQEIRELKTQEQARYKEVQTRLREMSESLGLEKGEYDEKNEEIKELEQEISREIKELEEVIKVQERLKCREGGPEEQTRVEEIKEKHPEQMKALQECSEVFNNNCNFPWYVIGSISFLMHAQESTKQPDDIDIIFHENDFEKVEQEFQKIEGLEEFESDQADTGCSYVKGYIEVGDKKVEIEAFAQSSEDPNGLVNPGAKTESGEEPKKEEKYRAIENGLDDGETFLVLDKKGQSELYLKNLLMEMKEYKLGTENHKADKFINRLTNLLELNEGEDKTKIKILEQVKQYSNIKSGQYKEIFWELSSLIKEFIQEKTNETKESQSQEYNLAEEIQEKDPQKLVETLKENIGEKRSYIDYALKEVKDEKEKMDNTGIDENKKQDFNVLCDKKIQEIQQQVDDLMESIQETEEDSSTSQEENQSRAENKKFSSFVFIKKFKNGFAEEAKKQIEEIRQEVKNI